MLPTGNCNEASWYMCIKVETFCMNYIRKKSAVQDFIKKRQEAQKILQKYEDSSYNRTIGSMPSCLLCSLQEL